MGSSQSDLINVTVLWWARAASELPRVHEKYRPIVFTEKYSRLKIMIYVTQRDHSRVGL